MLEKNARLPHITHYTQNNQWLDNLAHRRFAVKDSSSQSQVTGIYIDARGRTLSPAATILHTTCLKFLKCVSMNKLLLVAHEACCLGRDSEVLMYPHLTEGLMRLLHVSEDVQALRDVQRIGALDNNQLQARLKEDHIYHP